jgi:putative membrane protein
MNPTVFHFPFQWARWHTHPEVWALCATLLVGYFLMLRLRPEGAAPATFGQKRNWVLAVAILFVSAEWPMHDLAEGYLYSVHMVQHLLLTMIVPPLVLTALPAWLVRALVPARAMRALRVVCRPLIALVLFNVVLVFTHWPNMVTATIGHEWAHLGLHALIFASAMVMWMPVLSPVLEIPRLAYPGQMLFLFLQSLIPTVPASFLTFGERPLYHIYETFPKPFGISALEDQRAAGLIMKIVGGAILWVFITVVFFKWHRLEHDEGVDALELRDVDHALNRMELSR